MVAGPTSAVAASISPVRGWHPATATRCCFVRLVCEFFFLANFADCGRVTAYSADGIYLYSTKDDPGTTNMTSSGSSIVPPNNRQSPAQNSGQSHSHSPKPESVQDRFDCDISMEEDLDRILSEIMSSSPAVGEEAQLLGDEHMDEEGHEPVLDGDGEDFVDEDEDEDGGPIESQGDERYSHVPTVFPRARFEGVCNIETVKDGAP